MTGAAKKRKKGQGRKPLPEDNRLDVVAVRLNHTHSAQFKKLGCAVWLRIELDKTLEPQQLIDANAEAQIKALTEAFELEQTKNRLANNRITELLAIINTHETTNKSLSTKFNKAKRCRRIKTESLVRSGQVR